MDTEKLTREELLALADGGNAEAQYFYGCFLLEGKVGPRPDAEKAASYLKKAALQGHLDAQLQLGVMYSSGEGVEVSETEALLWSRRAAEQGDPRAQFNLAHFLENRGDLAEAATWYRRAADQGLAGAQASLGFALSAGRGVQQDLAGAVKYYRLAAEQGHSVAQSNLGGMYSTGKGVPMDASAAAHWVRLAADQGFGPAQFLLSQYLFQGNGVVEDPKAALTWLIRAATQGSTEAQNDLGIRYATGSGVDFADPWRAFMWFAAAAGRGADFAAANRDRVPVDKSSEFYGLVLGAAGGDASAMFDLGVRLHHGQGIQQDPEAARYWIRRAAEAGDAQAQTTYALLLDKGDEQRLHWLTRAAAQGDARGLFNLGLMYLTGTGTGPDIETGAMYVLRASLLGFPEARGVVEELRRTIAAEAWPYIFDRIPWPSLFLHLGPLIPGHFDGVGRSRETDGLNPDSVWFKYEQRDAESTFHSSSKDGGSLLDVAFDAKLLIAKYSIAPANHRGAAVACVTICQRDLLLEGGFPVYWPPSEKALDSVTQLLAVLGGRMGVEWGYFTPV